MCDNEFERMIDRLSQFLAPSYPIIPGEKDVLRMIGVLPYQSGFEVEVEAMSRRAWDMLVRQPVDHCDRSATLLEEERAVWKAMFENFNGFYLSAGSPPNLDELSDPVLDNILLSMSAHGNVAPPLSTRFDLRTRYAWRQFVRSKKANEPYNIDAFKKANDGIDFRLYTYLALPALIVATEKGFFSAIKNIKSFQTSWIKKPDTLAEMWKSGSYPAPVWP